MYAKNSISQKADIYQLIREINTTDIIQRFNIVDLTLRGRRWVGRCPLPNHNDKTPSFIVFPDGGWRCFGCGEHGDAVDLVAGVYSLRSIEAARMIVREFGIQTDKPLPPAARRRVMEKAARDAQEREIEEVFQRKVDAAHRALALVVRTTNRVLAAGGYQAYYDLAELLQGHEYREYLLQCLLDKDPEVQMLALTSEEVRRWVG